EYEGDTDLYFSKMRLTIQNLKNVGVVIDDSQAVAKLVTDFARVNVHTDFCSHYNFSSRDPNFSMSLDQAEQMILSAIRKQPDNTTTVSLASSSSSKKFNRTEKVQYGKVGKRKYCKYCRRPGHDIKECWRKHPHLRPKQGNVEDCQL